MTIQALKQAHFISRIAVTPWVRATALLREQIRDVRLNDGVTAISRKRS